VVKVGGASTSENFVGESDPNVRRVGRVGRKMVVKVGGEVDLVAVNRSRKDGIVKLPRCFDPRLRRRSSMLQKLFFDVRCWRRWCRGGSEKEDDDEEEKNGYRWSPPLSAVGGGESTEASGSDGRRGG
jgi:hypothetical protein